MKRLTVAAALLLLWMQAGAQPPPPAPLPAPPAANKARGTQDCLVEPSMVVSVGSPVDGVLEEVAVDRGATVHKGQVVAKLRSGVEAAIVEVARGRVEFDRRRVQRNQTLFEKQMISAQERDEMVTEARLHEGELKRDLEILNLRTIVSPINGVVVERRMAAGDLIRAEKAVVLKLAQLDPLNVEVILPAEQFASIHAGMGGAVSLAPFLPGTHKASVVVVDRLIDPASGTFFVRLRLPNPKNRIPAGIRCKVEFMR